MTHPVHSLPPQALEVLFDEAFKTSKYAASLTVFCEIAVALTENAPDLKVTDIANGLNLILKNSTKSVNAIADVKAASVLAAVSGEH